MSSLIRRIQRRWKRGLSAYQPSPSVFKSRSDGGYSVLHPTKGWRRVSAKRANLYK